MFGLKLKSWMEAHLGRPHRQKSTSSASGATSSTSSASHPGSLTCSSSSHHQKRTGAPKDITGSCSSSGGSASNSTTNSTSSSNASTSTAIGVGTGSFFPSSCTNINSNNTPNTCNFQPTTSILTATTSSDVATAAAIGSVTGGSASAQQQEIKIGKYGGGGGGSASTISTSQQNGETIGTKKSEIDSQSLAPGETDLRGHQSQQQQQHRTSSSIIPASGSNIANNNRASTVSTSVSNSTSIISGGSSCCNSLSSPDTGYSTDGYSPKSVYPALSFPATNEAHRVSTDNKHSSASSSTASKSSCTISSLVSSELLHSSESKQTSASCSVHEGLDEHTPSSITALLLTSSQSSTSSGATVAPLAKGLPQHSHHHSIIPENEPTQTYCSTSSKEKQVIMADDGDDEGECGSNKKSIQLELEQKLPPSGTPLTSSVKASTDLNNHSHSKFSPFSIDFFKRSSSSIIGGGNKNDNGNEQESSNSNKPSHGRTHRRAESMDARTPSHEDYKPLVKEDGDEHDVTNPSSHFMTSSSAVAKNIRTSFVLGNSGQLVEFNSFKSAFSICSPRRERTRIKTNPWITLSNNNKKDESIGSKSDSANNKSTHANLVDNGSAACSSASDGETDRAKMSGGEESSRRENVAVLELTLETVKGIAGSKRVNLLEINKKNEEERQQREDETDNFMEDETGISIDHDSDDRSSSATHILYRISSTSDSGKGSLVDPETNRNSTESSCLLSEDSTRNSIISQEASGSSCCGRSSSGESISQHHHQNPLDNVTLGHASPSCFPPTAATATESSSDQKEQQQGHFLQKRNGDQGQRTFRNASVETTDLLLVKSESVSVGVGTTGSNKSANRQHPVMVDKETDILSDWATNTDVEDTEDDLETDQDGGNNDDNETVTPAPSSPGTDVDRALFSQSSSATTDIDFGDSSAATQASSTQVFPPSSLLRQNPHHQNSNSSSTYANANSNGVRFHNGSNYNSQSESCGGENYDHQLHLQQQHNHNINMNTSVSPAACYTSVIPIVRPVLAAAQQQRNQDAFSFDLVNHHHTLQSQQQLSFQPTTQMFYPNFPMEEDLLEDDYPQVKAPSGHKGLARGALGFLRKIFKKGACSSQRRSPDSLASSAAGKKSKCRGKSDNNLASFGLGMGSPLLTISEPLSNPRYSAAVLTTKKQMNPPLNGCYFLTPTPNSFRRRSAGHGGGVIFGGQSDPNNSGSDSKGSSTSKQLSKSVKTDIIRLPQGPLSPQQAISQSQHHQRATSSSHSTGSSSSCSALSGSNNSGIPQQCSTFLPHAAPVVASSFLPSGSAVVNNSNLIPTISPQSNSVNNTNNSSSTSSSAHSLMSMSTCSGSNQPSSQRELKIPILVTQNLYANSVSQNPITCTTNSRLPTNPFIAPNNNISSNKNNNGNISVAARSPPSPTNVILENSAFLSGGMGKSQQSRRDLAPSQQSLKGLIPSYESSPRLQTTSSTSVAGAKMNSPSFNNSYSPIHRLVVTGGSHLRNGNPSSNNIAPVGLSGHYPHPSSNSGESPHPIPRYNGSAVGGTDNNSSHFTTQIINRSQSHQSHPCTSMGQSPLLNHRSSPHPQQLYPPAVPLAAMVASSSSSQQPPHNYFASPSPILRNPRYQYITSSNQNSPVLSATKRLNSSSPIIMPCLSGNNGSGVGPNGPPPLLTTFTALPSSSTSASCSQRESLIKNNNNSNANTNTITIGSSGGSVNLNPPSSSSTVGGRQVVSTSLSYNEFENLSRHQHQNFSFHTSQKSGNNDSLNIVPFIPAPPHLQPQQLLNQSQHKNNKTHHLQQNHYYSSPIVKQRAQQQLLEQTSWNNNEGGGGIGRRQYQNLQQQQRTTNQNLRFNSFLVRHRQLPQFYHTQWGLQERIYETVDSEDERSSPGRVSDEISGGNDQGEDCAQDLPIAMSSYNQQNQNRSHVGGMTSSSRMKHSYSLRDGGFLCESNHVDVDNFMVEAEERPTKRSKPKSLSASGRPFPRPVVALPMMPAGTFLSETETRLLEADNESDRKYKRLINEAEALLKEISVEKEKRAAAVVGSVHQRDNNSFRLEDCPQSDPLRRKAYDCWALRRLQQELAGCCASPPVLHRSRLNLQSPSTPTVTNNPYLSHFHNMGMPMLPQQVPYAGSSAAVDPNQNSFEF